VSMNEFSEILAELFDDLQLAPDVVKIVATHFFKLLDTDNNGLVDGLEFLSTMAICSGMKKTEMLEFSLTLYDFNNAAALTFDELVLAMKSACSGMCKVHNPVFKDYSLHNLEMPTDEQLEGIASLVFSLSVGNIDSTSKRSEVELALMQKNIKELTDDLLGVPEVCSWLSYFCNFMETRDIPQYTEAEVRDILTDPIQPLKRILQEKEVVEWSVHYSPTPIDTQSTMQWYNEVAHLTPLAYANKTLSHQMPTALVSARWIYGYEVEHGRKNVFYTFSNDILYPVGKYVILYTLKTHQQKFFTAHTETVSVVQMHPMLTHVASGEVGDSPAVMVWDADSLQVLHHSSGNYRNGISQLSFSPNGDLLLVVDNAPIKTLFLLQWKQNNVIFQDSINAKVVLSAQIMPRDGFAITADCNIWFWTKYSEGYIRREGIFVKNKAKEALTCMVLSKNSDGVVTGSINGKVMLWNGINCTRQVRGHTGPVNILHFCADGVISAGKDSRIRMWTSTLEPRFLFDVSKFGIDTSVLGVALSRDATTILFSTADADLFEISAIDGSDLRGGPIVKSHAFGNINCVDTHPSKFEFVTIGQDKTVRVVDMLSRSLLRMAQLDAEGRAIAYSPVGDIIAIGTDNSATSGCQFVILNEETLAILHSARDSRFPVTSLKFSPEGETLAMGMSDGSILLYSVHDDYELVAKCSRHTSAIIGLDFSSNGEWLRSNSILGDLHFFNVDDGNYQSNIPSMRDVQWSTQECMFSWHTKGIHSLEKPIERLTCCSVPHKEEKSILACGSTLGQVRFFTYPSPINGAESIRFAAHSNAIADVRFSFDGCHFISVGKYDHSIIQWSIEPPIDTVDIVVSDIDGATEDLSCIEFETLSGEQVLQQYVHRPMATPIGLLNDANLELSQETFRWTVGIVDPTSAPEPNILIPDISMRLQHVYGYETTTLRNNLYYLSTNELVYTNSSFGIVWNNGANSQKVYKVSFVC
jgi:WD40 repeat protein